MIKIEFPEYKNLKKIRVRLDKPRVITYKDNRKTNPNVKTFLPEGFDKYKNLAGVYIICEEDKVVYIGSTNNLFDRIKPHVFLKKNPDIKFIYFLELKEKVKRYVYEILYKFHYFGKVKPEYYAR